MTNIASTPNADNPGKPGEVSYVLPPDPDDDVRWLGEVPAEESRNTTLRAAYLSGGLALTGSGISDAEVADWFAALPAEERQFLDGARTEAAAEADRIHTARAVIETGLMQTAPELMCGELPAWMAGRIGSEYVLGINQSGIGTVEEGQAQLNTDGGVNMVGRSLDERFVLAHHSDPNHAKQMVINGFYGPLKGGKMVIAIPIPPGEGSPYVEAIDAYRQLVDIEVSCKSEPQFSAINSKYVAGFIDPQGSFYANNQFMTDLPPDILGASDNNAAVVSFSDWV